MSGLKLYLFGPPRLERDGEAINPGLRKAMTLRACLAVTRQSHSRDVLATLFWPDDSQREARAKKLTPLTATTSWPTSPCPTAQSSTRSNIFRPRACARGRDESPQARQYFRQALEIVARTGAAPAALDVLVGWADLLFEGDPPSANKKGVTDDNPTHLACQSRRPL